MNIEMVNEIRLKQGVSGSETEETNFDNIITGFYKGDRDWDSTYTYGEYKLTNDVSNLIKKKVMAYTL